MQNQTQPNQQLDPTIVNMARAIKATETAGQSNPYTAKGKSGEYGAYQYTEPTWVADSQKYLGQAVPLQSASIAQQNEVAYKKIADLKAQGYNPAQVASIWNSGKPDPTGNVGTNSKGVNYDTPQYVKSVVNTYNQFKSGLTPNIQPTSFTVGASPTQSESNTQKPGIMPNVGGTISTLGSSLGSRLNSLSSHVGDVATQLAGQKGSQNWWSDLLQAGGDVAGGIGDIINSGLNLIPGVSKAEDWLGGEVGKAADTQVGQSVVKEINSFKEAHPELAGDIGAGLNIATLIPIFKGLGVVKDIAGSGLGTALEGAASNGLKKEILGTASRTVAGRNAVAGLGDNLDNVIKEGIIKPRSLPDIVDGKYNVAEALAKNEEARSVIAEQELQPLLEKVSTTNVADRMPLEQLRQEAISNAKDQLHDEGAVNKMFDRIGAKYGDYPTLAQLNDAKKLVSKQVPQRAFDLEGYNANYNVRQVLQKGIEDGANSLGLGDVNAINGKMRLLYQADDLLKSMEGKPVKVGMISKLLRKGVSVGAGMAAEKLGGGLIGGLGAGYLTDIADKGIQGSGGALRRFILNRTEKGAVKNTAKKAVKRLPGLVGGVMAQQSLKE